MILAIPPQTLSPSQKTLLNEKGYIVIETNEPDKIRFIAPEAAVNANDYYMAALHALAKEDNMLANSKFVKELYRRLLENEDKVNLNQTCRKKEE